MTPDKLQSARDRLDELDQRVVHALAERQRLVEEVAALKSDPSLPLQDATREHDLLARVAKLAEAEKLDGYFVQSLYRRILEHSVRFQAARQGETKNDSALVVAYQGMEGSYSRGLACPSRRFAAGSALSRLPFVWLGHGCGPPAFRDGGVAPAVGLEPTTNRLTADRSTTELRWNFSPLRGRIPCL